ncbi:putative membrane protein [Rickettsia amblyommatis str. Darkwater]|uniref:Putative membrane protein n=1 Tax=Rickettsia amblyommatis str. Ac/Pa TaxID=1359164 RepID=A0A0F3N5Z9_RICAM|nr:putative membrane protein [Rickettsia amblyommatis str. Ac/Pa]KJV93052.1 putative membrane protein [Rickettsia amblyommatis str. Darkwater]
MPYPLAAFFFLLAYFTIAVPVEAQKLLFVLLLKALLFTGVFIEDLSLLSSAAFFIPSSGVLIDDLLLKFSLLMHIS